MHLCYCGVTASVTRSAKNIRSAQRDLQISPHTHAHARLATWGIVRRQGTFQAYATLQARLGTAWGQLERMKNRRKQNKTKLMLYPSSRISFKPIVTAKDIQKQFVGVIVIVLLAAVHIQLPLCDIAPFY